MATIQHKDIPESLLHEPKGASTAGSGLAYISNGAGSGTWRKLGSDTFQGLTGDAGIAGKRVVSNGSNGFNLVTDVAHGMMAISSNSTNFAVTAAADAGLKTSAEFQLLTGTGAPWAGELIFGTTFTTDRITALVSGIYRADLVMSIKAFPTATAKIATKFRINATGSTVRNLIAKSVAAGDEAQLSGFQYLSLNAGDYVQVMVASTAAGSLLINDAGFGLTLVRAT